MEIQTTIREFSETIRNMNIPLDTAIRVIIDESEKNIRKVGAKDGKKNRLPFLDDDIWDDENGPSDISENIDSYLYDSDAPYGG